VLRRLCSQNDTQYVILFHIAAHKHIRVAVDSDNLVGFNTSYVVDFMFCFICFVRLAAVR
jgi:hypothetical protein